MKDQEESGQVGRTFIGNAAIRCYAMRDLIDLAQTEAARDYNIFRTPDGQAESSTPLDFGTVVLSPEMMDGAGRPDRIQWCVENEGALRLAVTQD